MTTSLTPDLALAYLRELSADFRAGIVIDAAGARAAGDPRLHEPAQALLHAHPRARELHATVEHGAQVFAIRGDGRAIVVVTGPHALPSVTRRDMRTALSTNLVQHGQEASAEHPKAALAEAVVTAVDDAFRP